LVDLNTPLVRRLLIVAECNHVERPGGMLCPNHFRVEIEEWAKYVESIRLLTSFSPSHEVPTGWGEYASRNIEVIKAQGAFSVDLRDKIISVGRSIRATFRILVGFRWADAVHVRGPSRNALLALLVAHLVDRPLYIKWAGEWGGAGKPSLATRMQRWLIMRRGKNKVVSVYEYREEDPSWIFTADTSSVTGDEIQRSLGVPHVEFSNDRVELLWVGRFSHNKNVSLLLRLMVYLKGRGWCGVKLHLVGDGSLRQALEDESCRRQLTNDVIFHGELRWEDLSKRYSLATVFLLPSGTEGFPKVAHEALLFGTPVVSFSVGALPRMLGGRGAVVSPEEGFDGFAEAVESVISQQDQWTEFSRDGRRWAASISIDRVVARHVATCEARWHRRFLYHSPMAAGVPPWGRGAE